MQKKNSRECEAHGVLGVFSRLMSQQHFQQVTESDFEKALQKRSSTTSHTLGKDPSDGAKPAVIRVVSHPIAWGVGGTGSEHPQETGEKSQTDGPRSIFVATNSTGCQIDADLARIIDAWPALPEATRQTVLRLIVDPAAGSDGRQ